MLLFLLVLFEDYFFYWFRKNSSSKKIMSVKCKLCDSENVVEWLSNSDFSIYSCNNCHNGYTLPSPSAIDYASKDFHANEIIEENIAVKTIDDLPTEWQDGIKIQINSVCSHLQKGSSILEIGCGEGILLNELKREGFNVSGIEPSETATQRARVKGLDIYQGYFPHEAVADKTYDLIIMSHVLEHLNDPHEVLSNINRTLRKDGMLLLVQTNFKGLIPRLQANRWYAWVPEQHFWHFTPKGVMNLVRQHEMVLVETKYYPLVHPNSRLHTIIQAAQIGYLIPSINDQFHIILRKV